MYVMHMYLEGSWLFGVCDSHDDQSNENQQVENKGSCRECINQLLNVANADHDGGQGGLIQVQMYA